MRNKNLKRIILHFTLSFCILIFSFFISESVFAARLFFESNDKDIGVNQQFKAVLKLDVENQNINAVEGTINFSKNLEVVSINDGSSVIPLWVKKPKIADANKIVFAGIIPGGYQGDFGASWQGSRPGEILEIIFKSKTSGKAEINLSDERVLLNDGLGTEAKTTAEDFLLDIKNFESGEQVNIPRDAVLPDEFSPEISRDPNIFENQWFLVFSTHDKDSGINHYEILEKDQRPYIEWFKGKKWIVAESPYLLRDQSLESAIYVKSIDNAGNERIEKIEPKNPLKWYENISVWGIIILILFSAGFVVYKSRFTYERRQSAN